MTRPQVGDFQVAIGVLSDGALLLYVSKQLGHANPDITLRVYSRWIPSESVTHSSIMDRKPDQNPDEEPEKVSKGKNNAWQGSKIGFFMLADCRSKGIPIFL